ISRQKYFGTPLPVWECKNCGDISVMGSKDEMKDKAKDIPENLELHRPWIDEVVLECTNCGSDMKRHTDVMDVWLDSSVAPDATLDYMGKDGFEPFDFITEGIDQTRGWYYSLLFSNVILYGKSPYRAVLNQELICDAEGEAMSSTKGNAVWADEAIERWNSDVLRFYLMWKTRPYERLNFDPVDIESLKGGFFNIIWNTKKFYKKYCEDIEFNEENLQPEDRWMISRTNSLISEISDLLDDYDINPAVKKLKNFFEEDFSRTYLKLVRDRTWPRYEGDDKGSAAYTINYVLERFTKLLAPFCPYITESIYRDIFSGKESVHLTEWPEVEASRLNDDLETKMEYVKKVIEAGNSARQESEIGLRYPLEKITVSGKDSIVSAVKDLESIVKDMLNVKEIEFGEVPKEYVVKPEYDRLGPKLGEDVKEVEDLLESSNAENIAET
ncbi:MAG: class I tRNA ligase family protein, partial [Candidatus Aenigmatarchaeota archaeon]